MGNEVEYLPAVSVEDMLELFAFSAENLLYYMYIVVLHLSNRRRKGVPVTKFPKKYKKNVTVRELLRLKGVRNELLTFKFK